MKLAALTLLPTPRGNPAIEELAKIIQQEGGQRTPVTVIPNDDKLEVVDGYRRCKALEMLGIEDVLVYIPNDREIEARLRALKGPRK